VDVTQFWQLIETACAATAPDTGAVVDALRLALRQLPPEEIVAFDSLLWEQLARSYQWDLWAAAYVVNGGCSDDGFDYFRGWLIAQGQVVFESALRDPDRLVDVVAGQQDTLESEDMLGVAYDAYRAVTGRELQSAGQPMPPEPSGDQWDESEAAMRAPLLALQAGYPLDGARIVVTGKLQGYTRAAITELLEELGATVDMAVTRHTTLLIVGEAPGAKLARARALGVKAIAETDFQRLRSAVRPP
jgi:hypothetical protein